MLPVINKYSRNVKCGGFFFLLEQKQHQQGGSIWAFPDGSVGKESACNAGDPGSTPGSGRSAGEGTGFPLPYAWASLVAQLVKNLPAVRETCVRPLGWEDPPEKGKASHSRMLGPPLWLNW